MEFRFLRQALFAGRSATAVRLGTILTLGRLWARTERCHTVYRGQDGELDYTDVQAVMESAASEASLAGQDLPPGTMWHFVRRQVSHCGLESADSPVTRVSIDSAGDMIPATPNEPLSLQAEQVAGGRIKLRWRYVTAGQEISPTGFRVYADSGSGFDFDSPDATVAYGLGGNGQFEWLSGALSDGQLYKFCVRSYATAGGETINSNYVSAVADSGGPDAATGLAATWEAL